MRTLGAGILPSGDCVPVEETLQVALDGSPIGAVLPVVLFESLEAGF